MSRKPRLLDLFCCQGGAAMGYSRAGFDVVGVDIVAQPRYPFAFVKADALEYLAAHGHEYDAIHASPPCQRYSEATNPNNRLDWPDLIEPTRAGLQAMGKPFVIENVEGARALLINPMMLCGTMFGLPIWRHRFFEMSGTHFLMTKTCQHIGRPILITGMGNTPRKDKGNGDRRYKSPVAEKRAAIGIDWMSIAGITEAIPPAYTEFIGKHLLAALAVTP